ncbi:MAG: hypothetical protein H8E13_03365 [Actinobacteria bacterium]|nr:hypothetical protein [Actinomycetota bacterium]
MTEKEYLEKIEEKEFDIEEAKTKFHQAKDDRTRSGWDDQADDGIDIMINNLPLSKTLKSYEKWSGKFYIDNWVEKALRFKKAVLQAADVYIDVCNDTGIITPAQELLENEINFAFDKFKFLRNSDAVIENHYYMGMGWSRQVWNTNDVDGSWRTGKPILEAIDDRKVWLDPGTQKPDKSDKRYLFHREEVDTNKLQKMYPDVAKKIIAMSSEDDEKSVRSDEIEKTEFVTMQYKKTITIDKRALVDELRGTVKYFDDKEFQEYMKKTGVSPEEMDKKADDYNANEALPEGIRMSEKVSVAEDHIFQVIFIPEYSIIIEQPQYIGKNFTYICMPSFHQPDSAYSFGWTYYLKDLLESSIIMMTIQLINTVKTNKPIPVVEAGALENEEYFLNNYYKLGVTAKVREDWRRQHPGQDPISWITPPQVGQMHLLLEDKINNAIKEFTGATDIARGQPPYSGMSGRQTGMLQVAANVINKPEIRSFNYFLKQHAEVLKEYIVFYRDYEHEVMGLDEQGNKSVRVVNLSYETMLENDDNYCHVIVEENAEAVKAMKEAKAVELFKMGMITWRDALRMQGIPNVEKLIVNKDNELGEKQIIEMINENPELQQMIREFAAGQQQGQSPENQQSENKEAPPQQATSK